MIRHVLQRVHDSLLHIRARRPLARHGIIPHRLRVVDVLLKVVPLRLHLGGVVGVRLRAAGTLAAEEPVRRGEEEDADRRAQETRDIDTAQGDDDAVAVADDDAEIRVPAEAAHVGQQCGYLVRVDGGAVGPLHGRVGVAVAVLQEPVFG